MICWVLHYLVGIDGGVAEFMILFLRKQDSVERWLDRQIIRGNSYKTCAFGDAVGRKGCNSFVGQHVFLNLILGFVEDMPVLLLAHQIGLVEGVRGNFDGLHSCDLNAQFPEFLYLIRVVGEQNELTFNL